MHKDTGSAIAHPNVNNDIHVAKQHRNESGTVNSSPPPPMVTVMLSTLVIRLV